MQSFSEEKVFKDPVHQYIYVQEPIIWDLINTSEFQRLRRIRQLGTSYFTFHGAEHSRFSHSLGVYEITRKIISRFERNQYTQWPHEEKLLCLCASLLHDVGHGPFSHSMERVFSMDHEMWSRLIILENTEISKVLRSVSDDFPQKVADVIAKTYESDLVVSLVSSQLDADRMDYLLRDSYFTGVSYGMFDLERILRVIRPMQGKLVIKESGMHAVEAYLMARYQMYWQVYYHPVTRGAEILLGKIFQRAKYLFEQNYSFNYFLPPLHALFEGTLTTQQYLMLDESFLQTTFMQWMGEKDTILADLCRRFMNRDLFKYVEYSQLDSVLVEEITSFLQKFAVEPQYYMEIDFPSELPYYVYRSDNEEKLPILLMTEDEKLVEISKKSGVVSSLSEVESGINRLYFPLDLFIENKHKLSPSLQHALRRMMKKS